MTTEVHAYLPHHRLPEKAAMDVTLHFRSAGAATTVTDARYRVDCLTTGKAIRAWTSLTPASNTSMTLSLESSDSAIVDQSHDHEQRQLTVEINDGTSAYSTTRRWRVVNNRGRT